MIDPVSGNVRSLLTSLQIFPAEEWIPRSVVIRLWTQLDPEFTHQAGEELLAQLEQLAYIEQNELSLRLQPTVYDSLSNVPRERIRELNNALLLSYNSDGRLWWEIPNDGYLYTHLVYHLLQAERTDEACRLLVGSPDWMQSQFKNSLSHTAYVADVLMLIDSLRDPLTAEEALIVAQLWSARQVANMQVQAYTDLDLQTLIKLGCTEQAFANAMLRPDAEKRLRSLRDVFNAAGEVTQDALDALLAEIKSIHPVTRMVIFLEIAAKLREVKDDRYPHFVNQALELYGTVKAEYQTALQAFLPAYARLGYAREALEMIRAMEKTEARMYAIGPVALELVKQGYENEALEIIAEIYKVHPRSVALGAIGVELARRQASEAPAVFSQAIEAAYGIEEAQTKVIVLLELVIQMLQANIPEAAKIFDPLIDLAQSLEQPIVRSNLLREIAVGLAPYDEPRAREVFKQVEAINAAIGKDKNLTDAYLKALAQAGFIEPVLEALQSEEKDSYSLEGILPELVKRGYVAQALAVADNIKSTTKRASILRQIANELAQANNPQAVDVFEKALSVLPQSAADSSRDRTVRSLAVQLARAGHTDLALTISRDHQEKEYIAYTLCDVAAVMADRAQAETVFEQALTAAGKISSDWTKLVVTGSIAAGMSKAGFSRGETVFDQLLAMTSALENVSQRDSYLGYLAGALAEAMRIEQALQVARSLANDMRRHEALRDVALELARQGDFDQALNIINAFTDTRYSGGSLRFVVIEMVRAGNIERALAIVEGITDSIDKARALAVVAGALNYTDSAAARTHFEEALRLVDAEKQHSGHPRSPEGALGEIAVQFARSGQIERAFEVIETITQTSQAEYTRLEVAAELARQRKIALALETLGIRETSVYLQALIDWSTALDELRPGLSLNVLREAVRITAWTRREWQPIYELMARYS